MTLKPCPFCGSQAKLHHAPGSWGYYSGKYRCECTNQECGVATRFFDEDRWTRATGTVDITDEAKANAVAVWNRRK